MKKMTSTTALADVLSHARRNVPYYRSLIPATKISADNALKVLKRLPLLTRHRLRSENSRLWSAIGDTRTWKTVRTTGTTDVPIEVVVDKTAQLAEASALAKQIDSCLVDKSWRERSVMHLTLHAAASSRTAPSPWAPGSILVKWNLSRLWQSPDEHFLRRLAEINGHIVTAMPSVMAALVDRVGRAGLIHPLLVVLSGERVEQDLLRRIAETFDCRVTSLYTMAEAGVVANGCLATSGYHVNDANVFLELLVANGKEPRHGDAGDIVITSLSNPAMPLIRYRTGDRGTWDNHPCGCPQRGRLFRLHTPRSREVLTTDSTGRSITSLSVAKLFAQLDVEAVHLRQDGRVFIVEYRAVTDLPTASGNAVRAAIRGILGPEASVILQRISDELPRSDRRHVYRTTGMPSPSLPNPEEIVAWARRRLVGETGIAAAVLTGSSLVPSTTTRFSDIDIELLVHDRPSAPHWRELTVAMHSHLAGLRVNVSTVAMLADSPLITCRLLAERHPIIGSLEKCGIEWPAVESLAAEARFWAQAAHAVLWTRVTTADRSRMDPVQEAWLASKHAINALRYHFLCQGYRVTEAHGILNWAMTAEVPRAQGIHDAFAVAREHRPPPSPQSGASDQYLLDAMAVIAWMRHGVDGQPET
ncbi:hypothetical protein AB0L13_24815 [Saccharopolyspora shandongensis]|uniref:hypothetical protein n=1 Tax=Saccharopolyspora shandongensis TaxID=418495 RepID=UPI00342185AE